jgi:D-glycero-alpha-D-manno-heptose-7-phosphate kinase
MTSDAPVGAGLGGSGAAGVALVGALAAYANQPMTHAEIAELAHKIESEDLGIIGGKQDQYAAAYGGFLALKFHGDYVRVEPMQLDAARIQELQARSVVVYTGQARISGNIHRRVQEAYKHRVPDTLRALQTIRDVANEFRTQLESGSLDALGELLNENWVAQKHLHPATSNVEIENLFRIALNNGALGGKALGAGGGGCLYFLAGAGAAANLQKALETAGAQNLPVQFDMDGLRFVGAG